MNEILEQIIRIALEQIHAMDGNRASFYGLDRDLELAVGEKERRIGALREHEREHGCVGLS